MAKSLLRSPLSQRIVTALVAAWIRLCRATTRWEVIGREPVEALWAAGQPVILCFWHSRVTIGPMIWPLDKAGPITVIVSESRDGDLIAGVVNALGIGAVRGSSARAGKDKGGAAAFRELLKLLKAGESIAITPDGPRGPRMRAEAGIAALAQLSGVAVAPACIAMANGRIADSWDRHVIPMPFGRGVMVWGKPVVMTGRDDAAREVFRAEVEAALNAATWDADARVGKPRVEPA
jgi:lysophospholipid acyltransferase (LPLAT)-like uncharacterized protein